MAGPDLATMLQAFAESTGEVFLLLATLEHPSFAEPIRVVNDFQPITSNGQAFKGFPFRVRLPDASEELGSARFTIDAIGLPTGPDPETDDLHGTGGTRTHVLSKGPIQPGSVVIRLKSTGEVLAEDDAQGGLVGPTITSPSGVNYSAASVIASFDTPYPGTLEVDFEHLAGASSVTSEVRSLDPADGAISVTLELVMASDPDTVQLEWPTMKWDGVSGNLFATEGRLAGAVFLNAPLQSRGRRFTPANNPTLF